MKIGKGRALCLSALAFPLLTLGCAGVSDSNVPPECADPNQAQSAKCLEEVPLPQPKLVSIPNKTAFGDSLTVIGEGFAAKARGSVRLHFVGSFSDTTGQTNMHDGFVNLNVQNAGRADFEFGPNNIFVPGGDRVGIFSGTVTVVNRNDRTGEEKISEPIDINMQVTPSIFIDHLRSVDGQCSGITREVTAQTNLAMGFRAIGIGTGSETEPLLFRLQFASPELTAHFVQNIPFPTWPLQQEPTFMGISATGERITLEKKVTDGTASMNLDPRKEPTVVRVNPMVIIGQSEQETVKIYKLFGGKLDSQGEGGKDLQLEVVAQREGGGPSEVVRRPVRVRVFNEGDLDPATLKERIIESYEPKIVCGCAVSNIYTGTDFTYTETSSETRSRTMSFNANINVQYGGSVNFGSWGNKYFNLFQGSFNSSWAQTLGTDASETISSEKSTSKSYSQHIPPNYSGICYRQTVRKERRGKVLYHGICGERIVAGDLVVTDWDWNVEVAVGPDCPPPPVKLKAKKEPE